MPGARELGRAALGAGARSTPGAPPGFRLADGVVPESYDLTLELDPERGVFTGHVVISIAVAGSQNQLWLHAVDLEIARARLRSAGRDEGVAILPGEHQMIGFALPHPVQGRIALAIDYTGRAPDLSSERGKAAEEGVFRKRDGSRWFLYSQSESIFARKIVPCFDEPRFKPAWRVTAVVPRDQVALGNAPVATERALPDGRREVRFAEVRRMASYLLAVAVGPFELVDAGKLGRAHVPVRLAVVRGDGRRTTIAVRTLPKIIDALESYLDAPLPLAKLDLVAVPRFFGAMENVGLITFNTDLLVGDRDAATSVLFGQGDFLDIAAHELAHQWFGNAVTPAWWDDLWLSEAFATWFADRTVASLRPPLMPGVAHRDRARALGADEQVDAKPIAHPIATLEDIEPAFDAITYRKGASVLAMFERFVGPAVFQTAIRSYLTRHTGTSVTSRAFLDALAGAATPAVGEALGSNLAHPGVPVVELELRCGRGAAIAASVRDAVTTPVCVRYPVATDTARACFLAGVRSELALPAAAGCPAWIVSNDGGAGYYRTVWRGRAPDPPVASLSPDERLTRADDAAAGVWHGDVAIVEALAELARLAAARDPDSELAALAIADAIDPLVTDAVRPAWAAWLAARFADELSPALLAPSRSLIAYTLRRRLVKLVRTAVAAATVAAARKSIDHVNGFEYWIRLPLAAAADPHALFEQFVKAAAAARGELRGVKLISLGYFPGDLAPRLVDLLLDPRFRPAEVWPAVAQMLDRSETAGAAWRAVHARSAQVVAALDDAHARAAIDATRLLCGAAARAEVAADLARRAAAIPRGQVALDRALATIDRCIARRAAAGDIAQALAAAPGGTSTTAP